MPMTFLEEQTLILTFIDKNLMSWAEEQSWFGLEDLVLDAIYEAEEDLRNGIWVAKDGTKYSISKMTTSHIKNCIRMIQRSNYRWRPEYLEPLTQELERRAQNAKKELNIQ